MAQGRRWVVLMIVLSVSVVCAGAALATARPENRVHKEYYDNGRLRMFLRFREGLIVRKKVYYPNGRLHTDDVYADGLPLRMRAYYETGQLCRSWDNQQAVTKYYDRDGRLRERVGRRPSPLPSGSPLSLICAGL